MNVKSAVFEYGFVRSAEYVGLVAPLIGREEDRPFGILAPDRHAAAPQLSKDLDMLAWHVPYLGWTRLPAEVSEFEITHFFSLRAEERSAVLTRYRDSLRLGAALQIGFLKMCGRPLDAIQRVPADLLKHLGEQLEIPAPNIATLRALYLKRRRTLYETSTLGDGISRHDPD
jgi:hypothetical protein